MCVIFEGNTRTTRDKLIKNLNRYNIVFANLTVPTVDPSLKARGPLSWNRSRGNHLGDQISINVPFRFRLITRNALSVFYEPLSFPSLSVA